MDGLNAILRAVMGMPLADRAYALATAYHETARTMQPIKERGGPAYFRRMYDIEGQRPHVARLLGNVFPGDGVEFAGRGYVQLTGRANYEKANAKLLKLGVLKYGDNLVLDPDLALRPDIAAAIMVHGMREGWFSGKDLDDDLPRVGPATLQQYVRSRDIINGTDKAEPIARYADEFEAALIAGGVQ